MNLAYVARIESPSTLLCNKFDDCTIFHIRCGSPVRLILRLGFEVLLKKMVIQHAGH